MSEVTIESLQKQTKEMADHIRGLVAQLEASKQMLNEQLASNLQLRTNLNIFGQANQEYLVNEGKLKGEIEALISKINELTPKPAGE